MSLKILPITYKSLISFYSFKQNLNNNFFISRAKIYYCAQCFFYNYIYVILKIVIIYINIYSNKTHERLALLFVI